MTTVVRNVVAGITLLAFTGCAVIQPIEDLSPASIRQQVRPGDVVHVAVADGRTFDLKVEKVEETSLTGTTLDNRRLRIAYASISELQVRDPGQAAAGTGLIVLIGVALVALVLFGFEWIGEALWDHDGD